MYIKEFTQQQLETMIDGAAFFGSGGGGPKSVAVQIVRKMKGTVAVCSIEDAARSGNYAAVVAYIGSPNDSLDVGIEAPLNALFSLDMVCSSRMSHEELPESKRSLEKIGYVLPVETGVNAIVACAVANAAGIPIIDGDGAGRAVPMLSMLSYAYPKAHTFHTVLANKYNDAFVLRLADVNQVENISGPIIELNNHKAGLSLWPVKGEQVKKSVAVPNTLTNCLVLGELFKTPDFINSLPEVLNDMGYSQCETLIKGRIKNITTSLQGNLDHTSIDLEGNGTVLRIISINENLLAWRDNSSVPVACAPNLISWVTEGGLSFSAADIEKVDQGYCIGGELNPVIYVLSISPHRSIKEFVDWPDIQNQFNDVVAKAGYPIPQMQQNDH